MFYDPLQDRSPIPQYIFNGSPLRTASAYTNRGAYLGITINDALTWNDHIDAVISKTNGTLRLRSSGYSL